MAKVMITTRQIRGYTYRVCVRTYSKTPETGRVNEEKDVSDQKEDENSALVQRFTQILESKLSETTPSFMRKDPQLEKTYTKYATDPKRHYKSAYQKGLSHLKNESLLNLNRHAKDLADTVTNKPWSGTESVHDANLRMILDLKPPPVKYRQSVISPAMSIQDRIENAKESSLDYKHGNSKKGDKNFRELYKEKLLGPSMFLNTSSPHTLIGMASTLADARINASINRSTGHFDDKGEMTGVRGKPLDKEYLNNCTDTNYFMTHILNKQETLPPWVDSQQSIDLQIIDFRKNMDGEWFKTLFYNLKPAKLPKDSILAKINKILEHPSHYYDNDFHSRQLAYVNEKIKLLNNLIRDYNLQCPSSTIHKLKLRPDLELRKLYDRVVSTLHAQALKWYENEEAAKQRQSNPMNYKSGGGMFGLFDSDNDSGGNSNAANDVGARQRVPEKLHLWKSIKEMFK